MQFVEKEANVQEVFVVYKYYKALPVNRLNLKGSF